MKIKSVHPLQWIADLIEEHPTFAQRKMFGGVLLYLHDRQMFFLAAKEEPWNGLMVCVSREDHPALMKQHPSLKPHPVLGKWLYIQQSAPDFESVAQTLTTRALRNDPLLGVAPKPKKAKSAKKIKPRGKSSRRLDTHRTR